MYFSWTNIKISESLITKITSIMLKKKGKKERTFSYLFGVMANRKGHSIAHCGGIPGAVLTIFVEFLDQGRVVGLWKMGLLIQQ